MNTLDNPKILFDELPQDRLSEKMEEPLSHFYQELNLVMCQNDIIDFHQWFSEMGYLSMFFNGIIRNDAQKSKTVVQEYCTTNPNTNEKYRCDGFFTNKDEVMIFEAKQSLEKNLSDNHFDIDPWLKWDDESIRNQLIDYYQCDKKFYSTGRFKRIFLTTLCFKTFEVKGEQHLKKAERQLSGNVANNLNRQWFYSLAFFGDCPDRTEYSYGIEVYGTITEEPINSTNIISVDS